jgi:hypothetical protein
MQVTVSGRAREQERQRAASIAQLPRFDFRDRADVDWEQSVLQVSRTGLCLKTPGREYRWHPGLLHTRVEAGWKHPLVRAMTLAPGDHVLDCTLGLGTDASFVASLTGVPVTAIELHPALALMTNEGLRGAGHAVRVVNADSRDFLAGLADGSFDIVWGDPMFPAGTSVTHSLDLVRHIGSHAPLGADWLQEARRGARRCVVVRDIWNGTLLETMSPDDIRPTMRQRPRYGIWRRGAGD